MAKLIHSMIRVLNANKSKDFYSSCFNLEEVRSLDFPKFSLHYLRNSLNDIELELTVNKDQLEPYNLGDGYGHIAFVVTDLETTYKKIKELNYAPRDIVNFKNGDELIARFFFVSDPDGYQIEVLEQNTNYK